METIIMVFIVGLLMIISFNTGVKKGANGNIKSPIEKIKDYKEEKKKEKERKELEQKEREIEEINLYNIEIYDGTPNGQRSFPGGN